MSAGVKPTVIITRPQPFAGELAAVADRQGWKPVILDVLATRTAPNHDELGQHLKQLLPVDQAIFTSRSAVTHTFRILGPADLQGSGVAAMGAGSAQELQIHGITSVLLPVQGTNSEALLQLDEFSAGKAGKAIIFCAPGGRNILQTELANRGWQVHIAETYERTVQAPDPSTLSAIRSAGQLVSVCTSGTAITACREQLPADIWQHMLTQPWVAISDRLDSLLRKAGAEQVFQSSGPGNGEVAETIRHIVNP